VIPEIADLRSAAFSLVHAVHHDAQLLAYEPVPVQLGTIAAVGRCCQLRLNRANALTVGHVPEEQNWNCEQEVAHAPKLGWVHASWGYPFSTLAPDRG